MPPPSVSADTERTTRGDMEGVRASSRKRSRSSSPDNDLLAEPPSGSPFGDSLASLEVSFRQTSSRRLRSPSISKRSDDLSLPKSTSSMMAGNVYNEVGQFQLPPSLLELTSTVRARKRQVILNQESLEQFEPPMMPLHVCGLPVPEECVGVCGKCRLGGNEETVLLCDGIG